MKDSSKGSGGGTLSVRERTVVLMAARGKSDAAIAEELGISPGTLATYWARVRFKTGLGSRCGIAVSVSQEESRTLIRSLADVVFLDIGDKGSDTGQMRSALMDLQTPVALLAHGMSTVFSNLMWQSTFGNDMSRIQVVFPLPVPLEVLAVRVLRQRSVELIRARQVGSSHSDTGLMCWAISGLPGHMAMMGV